MSYDLPLWEGRIPADDNEAGDIYTELAESDDLGPTTDAIRSFAAELAARYPQPSVEDLPSAPWYWSSWPLVGERSGGFLLLNMPFLPLFGEVCEFCTELAEKYNLTMYETQAGTLIRTATPS